MKTKFGVLIFLFLTGLILVATQPNPLYAGAETGAGTLWDPFVNVSLFTLQPLPSFTGTKLSGPLSIYYNPTEEIPTCSNGQVHANMFYTVRLSKGFDMYTFEGTNEGTPAPICLGDVGTPGSGGQGDVIIDFLKSVVLKIFPDASDAQVKSVDNARIADDSKAFVADITIAVKQ